MSVNQFRNRNGGRRPVFTSDLTDERDPVKVPGPVKTLKDMSAEERAEMLRLYARVTRRR